MTMVMNGDAAGKIRRATKNKRNWQKKKIKEMLSFKKFKKREKMMYKKRFWALYFGPRINFFLFYTLFVSLVNTHLLTATHFNLL